MVVGHGPTSGLRKPVSDGGRSDERHGVRFSGSVPANYERYMVPLLFRPYARSLARTRRRIRGRGEVLETAAGTGVVTDALARALPDAEIVATDLNQAMLDVAATRVTSANVSIPPSGRARPAVRRRQLRPRRLPVRRHVLSRQGEGQCGGAAGASRRRSLSGRDLGPDRAEPPLQPCPREHATAVSGQPADVHETRAVQLLRAGMDRARPGRRGLQRT